MQIFVNEKQIHLNTRVEIFMTLGDLTKVMEALRKTGKMAIEEKRNTVYLKLQLIENEYVERVDMKTGTCIRRD